MIDFKKKTLLVLAPHPDDEVVGCAGLIQTVVAAAGRVYVLFMTVGTTYDFGTKRVSHAEDRLKEIGEVETLLALSDWRVALQGDEYHLQLDLLPQRQLVAEIESGNTISLEAIKPDILALPYVGDYNQDHRAVAEAALTACRPAPRTDKWVPSLIVSYESPMNQWTWPGAGLQPNFFLAMSAAQMKKKMRAMELCTSQVRRSTHPRNGESLKTLASLRGTMIGQQFAEAFYCHKLQVG